MTRHRKSCHKAWKTEDRRRICRRRRRNVTSVNVRWSSEIRDDIASAFVESRDNVRARSLERNLRLWSIATPRRETAIIFSVTVLCRPSFFLQVFRAIRADRRPRSKRTALYDRRSIVNIYDDAARPRLSMFTLQIYEPRTAEGQL